MPADLIYQAIAESGFQVQAVNGRSGAAGMWQFMPFRGAYGLERNGWVDERFDPEKSTRAYAREIKKNYQQFGDWYLAMAAYDWGPGNVQRAVQRTGYADFWELYRRNNLPQETKNYVPIILAAAVMAKNPVQYGLTDINADPPVADDTVTVNGSIDLRLVADIVNVPVQQIVGLNPSLLRMMTPPDEPYDLHLPSGTKSDFMEAIAEIPPDKRTAWRYHRVQPDDTLAVPGEDLSRLRCGHRLRQSDRADRRHLRRRCADYSHGAAGRLRHAAQQRALPRGTRRYPGDARRPLQRHHGTATPLESSPLQRDPAWPDPLCSGAGARFRVCKRQTWPSAASVAQQLHSTAHASQKPHHKLKYSRSSSGAARLQMPQ